MRPRQLPPPVVGVPISGAGLGTRHPVCCIHYTENGSISGHDMRLVMLGYQLSVLIAAVFVVTTPI
jgi:hypothetical protein